MIHVDNIIFFSDCINIRAGGPSGYIANLKSAIQKSNNSDNIVFINATNLASALKRRRFFGRILASLIIFPTIRRKLRNYITSKQRVFYSALDKYDFKTITTHSVEDTIFIRQYIKHRKLNAILLQMSHSPQPPSQEIYDYAVACGDIDAKNKYTKMQKLEHEAFTAADMFIFPSPESVECYRKPLKYFDTLVKTRPIQYVRTGCQPLTTDKKRDEMRTQYNIKTPFVITYIGRHNKIKGYDILQQVAKKVLKERDDVTFLIGGRPQDIPPLEHPRWVELGQINPADTLMATDLFILPNRQTYFDLILLEVLSTGTPVIASNTGGNKTVYKDTNIITLYDDVKDCVTKIMSFLDNANCTKLKQSDKIKQIWLKNYSPQCFADNYIRMIKGVSNA